MIPWFFIGDDGVLRLITARYSAAFCSRYFRRCIALFLIIMPVGNGSARQFSLIDGIYLYSIWRCTSEQWFVYDGARQQHVVSPALVPECGMMVSLGILHGWCSPYTTPRSYLIRVFCSAAVKAVHSWQLCPLSWYTDYTRQYSRMMIPYGLWSDAAIGLSVAAGAYGIRPDCPTALRSGLLSVGLHRYFLYTHNKPAPHVN